MSGNYSNTNCAGGFIGTFPRQAEALDGIGDMTLHGFKPDRADMAPAHRPQPAVYSSPISSDQLCNVPKGHATVVSSTVSPTAANVSCCSGNGGTTSVLASASQHNLYHAAVALQCTKQENADRSDTAAESVASQVTSLPCAFCFCTDAADCCCSMSCHCLVYTFHCVDAL